MSETVVFLGILGLSAIEIAAVTCILLFYRGDQQTAVAVITGLVGPILATVVAVWQAAAANRNASAAQASAQAAHAAAAAASPAPAPAAAGSEQAWPPAAEFGPSGSHA